MMQDLLKELEEFAFRGIPDMRCYSSKDTVAREETIEMVSLNIYVCFFFKENVIVVSHSLLPCN